jgi:transposase-like protein
VTLVISDSHSRIKAAIQQVFVQTEEQSAHATWREVTSQLEKSFPAVTEMMDEAEADVEGIFPNEESITRLLGAVLTKENEK